MKKFFRALLLTLFASVIALSAFSFAACGPQKDDDKIYVGMECGYIPFNYTQSDDANGAVKISNAPGYANGYDVMIAKAIAEKLDKELVIVKYEWTALVNAVQTGTLDFIIAGMSPTEERLKAIDFSDPYYESNLVIVVREDGPYANATTLADFRGATIVAQQGTFHDVALQEQAADFGITRGTPMDSFPMMTAALSVGTIDGYVAEQPGAIADCSSVAGLKYIPLVNNETGFQNISPEDVQLAVGIKKGSELTAQVNAALAEISADERDEMMQRAIELATGDNVQ